MCIQNLNVVALPVVEKIATGVLGGLRTSSLRKGGRRGSGTVRKSVGEFL